eukprot:m.45039 g.45039  ORF g.45039 m.45039 type:complete len:257 (+) comp10860_c0_seq2:187-957(+)
MFARRAKKKGAPALPPLSLPTASSAPDDISSRAMKSLRSSLKDTTGRDRQRLEEFIFNKGRFMDACELNPQAFEVLKPLASGVGRSVYKVKHTHTALVLVQKVVRYEKSDSSFHQLKNELQLLHECHGPEIINFYGSFLDGDDIHIIMEYMNGGSLQDVVQRVGRVDEPALAYICGKIVAGLRYLDKSNVLHRDLKPDNVLVNTQGEVKLCDFGISRKLLTCAKAQTFVGTTRYMAPERLVGSEYSVKSDIWSLGT